MSVTFYKMSGSGNDFVMLDGRQYRPSHWPAGRIRDVCDRREGAGADGLVILEPVERSVVRMHFYNCDGSPAAMCGNAALCSTRLSARLGLAPASGMRLITGAGTFSTRCVGEGAWAELNLDGFEAPMAIEGLGLLPSERAAYLACVGVPHLVVLVDDVDRVEVHGRGGELRRHPKCGPEGANVNFVSPGPKGPDGTPHWPMRTYERGVEGETLACGTGAVAAAAALIARGEARSPLVLTTRSGKPLSIRATVNGTRVEDVWLAGEGRLVYTGELEL
ncbi:MAG TPA: diaminopimelate epimerase [Gemmatimonadales bacterium]|nr:diaminopimelate epimerase [Gemmatimonadales bacterium]